jgi:hypothetical protein
MHHSDYRNISGLGLIHDPEWKPLHETSSHSAATKRTTNAWMDKNVGQRVLDLPDKVCAQTGCLSFVELGRRD